MLFSIFYFSGTGNTQWTVRKFKELVEEKNHTANLYSIEKDEKFTLETLKNVIAESDYIGFAHPIYGANIPPIMKSFMERIVHSDFMKEVGHKKIFVISTVGYVNACGYYCEKKLFEHTDFEMCAYINIQLCNNVSTPKMKTKAISKEKLELREQNAIKNMKDSLEKMLQNKRVIQGIRPYLIAGMIIRRFSEQSVRDCYSTLSVDKERCSRCLKCVKNCPTKSITYERDNFEFASSCTSCFRCYNICPNYAVCIDGKVALPTQYLRYHGPEYKRKI